MLMMHFGSVSEGFQMLLGLAAQTPVWRQGPRIKQWKYYCWHYRRVVLWLELQLLMCKMCFNTRYWLPWLKESRADKVEKYCHYGNTL